MHAYFCCCCCLALRYNRSRDLLVLEWCIPTTACAGTHCTSRQQHSHDWFSRGSVQHEAAERGGQASSATSSCPDCEVQTSGQREFWREMQAAILSRPSLRGVQSSCVRTKHCKGSVPLFRVATLVVGRRKKMFDAY